MKKIVVFGSINTDLVIETDRIPQNGETYKGKQFFTTHGGKGANQAVAAARLGANVDFIGCVGNDVFGHDQLKNLQAQGINTKYIQILSEAPTGTAIIISIDHDNRIIIHGGANDDVKASQFESYLAEQFEKGIFVTQLENNKDEIIRALKLAKVHGYITIFNPAPAVPLETNVYPSVDFLVINQTEAEILSGIYPKHEHEAKRVYDFFKTHGLQTLILTLGKEGSLIFHHDETIKIDAISVDAVDTTGAGDSYIGAFAYGLANDYSIHESATLASKVAALAVTKAGAQTAMPTRKELKILMNKEDLHE